MVLALAEDTDNYSYGVTRSLHRLDCGIRNEDSAKFISTFLSSRTSADFHGLSNDIPPSRSKAEILSENTIKHTL